MEQKEIKKQLSSRHLRIITAVCQKYFKYINAVIEVWWYDSIWYDTVIFVFLGLLGGSDALQVQVKSEQVSPESPAADRETLLSWR